jgi:hypothetical protein
MPVMGEERSTNSTISLSSSLSSLSSTTFRASVHQIRNQSSCSWFDENVLERRFFASPAGGFAVGFAVGFAAGLGGAPPPCRLKKLRMSGMMEKPVNRQMTVMDRLDIEKDSLTAKPVYRLLIDLDDLS